MADLCRGVQVVQLPRDLSSLRTGIMAGATCPIEVMRRVIGIPDDRYGEEIVAWIKFHPGHGATAQELQAWCKDRIACFKTPRYFRFVEELPKTVTGKVQKFRMREISIEELQNR